MSGHETLADIVAEMRKVKGFPVPYAPSGYNGVWATDLIDFADRIEAAAKRDKAEVEADALAVGGIVEAARHKECGAQTTENSSAVGNAAAMREALEHVEKLAREFSAGNYYVSDFPKMLLDAIQPALAAPPRNCDVGTPEEQTVRFDAFVRDRRVDLNCTGKCPAHNGVDYGVVNCVLQWAQMPYEAEGGAE